jgi:Na+-driven multidrug efflux pump
MAFANPVIQLILLLLLNAAWLVYLLVKRPLLTVKNREYPNHIYVHNTIVSMLIQFVLLIFVFLYSSLSTSKKVLVCNFVVALIIWGFCVNFGYFVFRTYHYYHHHVWKIFVGSNFFRINYIIEHLEWVKDYEMERKKLVA